MNLQSLKYLATLADHPHFSKAAEMCFVSQPTLSMQIKKLEDELGIYLLERTNKSVRLTEVGKTIASRAKNILSEIDAIRETALVASDPHAGHIKIGIIPTLAPYFLPHIIPALTKNFPKLSLYLFEEQTAVLIEKLQSGKLDMVFLALPIVDRNLVAMPLFEEEFLLAVPHAHPLAKKKILAENDLVDKSLLLLQEGHCLRDQALSVCHKTKALALEGFSATSIETLRHMVSAGVGITLIPKLACKTNDGLCYIPFAKKKFTRTIGCLWRKTAVRSVLLKEMATEIKTLVKILEK